MFEQNKQFHINNQSNSNVLDCIRSWFTKLKSIFNEETDIYQIPQSILKSMLSDFSRLNFHSLNVLSLLHEDFLQVKSPSKKSQGIFYTDEKIADLIVMQALGAHLEDNIRKVEHLIEKKKYKEALEIGKDLSKLRILDPACGIGIFLISAFNCLKKYFKLLNNLLEPLTQPIEPRIVEENLYGIDLDSKAVAFTTIALLLLGIGDGKEHSLKTLNIKLGNALITDTSETLKKYFGPNWNDLKPFNWEEEFNTQTFDYILGNPPYVSVTNLPNEERTYLLQKFQYAHQRFDLYLGFIEKMLGKLTSEGILGFLLPYSFLVEDNARKLREHVHENYKIVKIMDFSSISLFQDGSIKNMVLILQKPRHSREINSNKVQILKITRDSASKSLCVTEQFQIPQEMLKLSYKSVFTLDPEPILSILNRIREAPNTTRLGNIAYIVRGARGVPISQFQLDQYIDTYCHRLIKGKNVSKFIISDENKWFRYKYDELYRPAFPELFENEKIVIRDISGSKGIIAALDNTGYYTDNTLNCCILRKVLKDKPAVFFKKHKLDLNENLFDFSGQFNLKYLLGVLNSNLMTFYFRKTFGNQLHVYPNDLEEIPIKVSSPTLLEKIAQIVEKIIRESIKHSDHSEKLKRELLSDKLLLNKLVYELYELTPQEIDLIERIMRNKL